MVSGGSDQFEYQANDPVMCFLANAGSAVDQLKCFKFDSQFVGSANPNIASAAYSLVLKENFKMIAVGTTT